ncbi:hypothetical protein [Mesorhizobium sp. LSJC269B00]|uniref:hypothetical protein n=1 Tax=Mesorhizobium sp. LSJC269B00 TaxID=1287326 RepID=UPI0004CDE5B0|nr:hypothetical protein [Mesorhizobium sp. LSJC269B00]
MQRLHLAAIDEGIGASRKQHQRFTDLAEAIDRPDIVGAQPQTKRHLRQKHIGLKTAPEVERHAPYRGLAQTRVKLLQNIGIGGRLLCRKDESSGA